MLIGAIEGLFVGFLLNLFNFSDVVLNGLGSLISAELNMNTYYFIFALLGIIYKVLRQNT